MSRNHEQLRVFRLADTLALAIYRHTRLFPDEERFGLQAQLRRAAVSSATNIVEGSARRSRRDHARFIDIALGSASEVDYLLNLSHRLGLLPEDTYKDCRNCTEKLVPGLQKLLSSIEALDG